jgi:hypothetical protein
MTPLARPRTSVLNEADVDKIFGTCKLRSDRMACGTGWFEERSIGLKYRRRRQIKPDPDWAHWDNAFVQAKMLYCLANQQ